VACRSERTILSAGKHRHHGNIAERMVHGLQQVMEHALDAEAISATPACCSSWTRASSCCPCWRCWPPPCWPAAHHAATAVCAGGVLALASQISLSRLYRQAWLSVLLFSGVLALPAIFMVPGERCSPCRCCTGTSPGRGSPVRPFCWAGPKSRPACPAADADHAVDACAQGHAQPGVPVLLVALLGMTHRYVFVLLQTASQMFEARRSRCSALGPHGAPAGGQYQRRAAGQGLAA
jgi:cobalt/nickel transport system permease protein